jgi:5-methylcytosine-specific restriction endonuclease McrA
MKTCEFCNTEINGSYGSGRFCNEKCARAFSTKDKREEINKKVSEKLSERKGNNGNGFKKGYDPRRRPFSTEDRKKAVSKNKLRWEDYVKSSPFEILSSPLKKKIILKEQNGRCLCGIIEWCGKKLSLQLDHIDGNRNNETRENLRLLCPNCHSITETFGGKNQFKRSATDDELWEAIKSNSNIHRALKSLGLNNGRNYARAQKMVLERGVEPLKTHF